jgi:hypothetical protein
MSYICKSQYHAMREILEPQVEPPGLGGSKLGNHR